MKTGLNGTINYLADERKQPYAQRWSFGLQNQFKGGFLGEASYVGNRGTRLGVNRNINATPLNYLSTSPVRDQATITYLGAAFPSPFFGLDPLFTSSTISREQMLRPYPHFGTVQYNDPVGYSWYHSMQARLERRLMQGFTIQISYTYSKSMEATSFLNGADPIRTSPWPASTARTASSAAASGSCPFGKGRKFGTHMSKPLEFLAGGWQVSGVQQRQSGQPIDWGQMLFIGDSTKLALPSRPAQRGPLVQWECLQPPQPPPPR